MCSKVVMRVLSQVKPSKPSTYLAPPVVKRIIVVRDSPVTQTQSQAFYLTTMNVILFSLAFFSIMGSARGTEGDPSAKPCTNVPDWFSIPGGGIDLADFNALPLTSSRRTTPQVVQ